MTLEEVLTIIEGKLSMKFIVSVVNMDDIRSLVDVLLPKSRH